MIRYQEMYFGKPWEKGVYLAYNKTIQDMYDRVLNKVRTLRG